MSCWAERSTSLPLAEYPERPFAPAGLLSHYVSRVTDRVPVMLSLLAKHLSGGCKNAEAERFLIMPLDPLRSARGRGIADSVLRTTA